MTCLQVFGVSGSRFSIWGFDFRVQYLGFSVFFFFFWGGGAGGVLGFRVEGFGGSVDALMPAFHEKFSYVQSSNQSLKPRAWLPEVLESGSVGLLSPP